MHSHVYLINTSLTIARRPDYYMSRVENGLSLECEISTINLKYYSIMAKQDEKAMLNLMESNST